MKIARTYRISPEADAEIRRLSSKLNISQGDVVAQAVLPRVYIINPDKRQLPESHGSAISRQPLLKPNGKIS